MKKIWSKFEETFIKLSKNIFLISTVLIFIAGVGAGFYYLSAISTKANLEPVTADVKLSEYIDTLNEEHAEKYKVDNKPESTESSEAKQENPNLILVRTIIVNINKYNEIMGEAPVSSEEKFIKYLQPRINEVTTPDNTVEKILKNLNREILQLLDETERLKVLPVTDSRRIYSRNLVDWFFDEQYEKIELVRRENQQKEELAKITRQSANSIPVALPFIGGAFVFFFFFLILVRVDLGIRKLAQVTHRVEASLKDDKTLVKDNT